jgi:menaquinone-dependent protoporphyrinogen oxidase
MRALVAVASRHGSTRGIAEAIAEELRGENLDVDRIEAGEVDDVTGYDAVVLGSGIYAGNWLPEARKFVERHREALGTRPVWLFSSGPLGAENPQPHHDPATLAPPMGDVEIRDHQIFVGKLDPADLNLAERLIAKVVGAPAGDFRDWAAIRGWAREIAASLRSEP